MNSVFSTIISFENYLNSLPQSVDQANAGNDIAYILEEKTQIAHTHIKLTIESHLLIS